MKSWPIWEELLVAVFVVVFLVTMYQCFTLDVIAQIHRLSKPSATLLKLHVSVVRARTLYTPTLTLFHSRAANPSIFSTLFGYLALVNPPSCSPLDVVECWDFRRWAHWVSITRDEPFCVWTNFAARSSVKNIRHITLVIRMVRGSNPHTLTFLYESVW